MIDWTLFATLVAAGVTLGVLATVFGFVPIRMGVAVMFAWDKRWQWRPQLRCVALRHRWEPYDGAYSNARCARCDTTTRDAPEKAPKRRPVL